MNVDEVLKSIKPGTKLRFCGQDNLTNLFNNEHPKKHGEIVEVVRVSSLTQCQGKYVIKFSDGMEESATIHMTKPFLPHDRGNMWWEVVIEIPQEELEL